MRAKIPFKGSPFAFLATPEEAAPSRGLVYGPHPQQQEEE